MKSFYFPGFEINFSINASETYPVTQWLAVEIINVYAVAFACCGVSTYKKIIVIVIVTLTLNYVKRTYYKD